ncbi:MAG: type I restriction-modification system subunit M [Lachnospiraceae bacterium]|jgi:type I restriction enzyme M protein|nr:type I restriction-modification system subunit M [Lachnospiraceae bacterium]
MNKQQLASKIWESADKMRSKIEANEYKDYILGFIFYKFLSNKEENVLKGMGLEDLKIVTEENAEIVESMQKRIGYFIAYENLFSTWIAKKSDFDVSNVRDALSAFNRLINASHKKVFENILDTLQTGLSKLGENSKAQTKAVSDVIYLIKDIPMDGNQDYDVLGFIYEYLISNFAANAGKKAGEFYTPHEVSLLMSEIVANHLKNRDHIEIYDPTSGSGSLLINIGTATAKYIENPNKIKYYAQELKQNTYNLTRMNLVMRGILPDNITTRNGDTLEDDWPFFDESHEYSPLYVDSVVSNPPYSQNWNPKDKESDPRYKEYGMAPKSKADFAFLLHDLYHLKNDGIMTIVLPHGVLSRSGEEGEIRKNLIEKNKIDAIIGLPANIFFGTGIPTIIMVLKKQKENTDIQIIDASKRFIKDGKNNKLRACDIKKIVDTLIERKSQEKFAKVVSIEEIRANGYNLNIPRYVDSEGERESFDMYACMHGGIPSVELNKLNNYFSVFANLKNELFKKLNDEYYCTEHKDVANFIKEHRDVQNYIKNFRKEFNDFSAYLSGALVQNPLDVNINIAEQILSSEIFKRIENIPIVDKYNAYQVLDDEWTKISADLEILKTEGMEAIRKVDPKLEIKKRNGKDEEVQTGWQGRIVPFELMQNYKLKDELEEIQNINNRLEDISARYVEIFEELSEEEKENIKIAVNNDNTEFLKSGVQKLAKSIKKDADVVEKYIADIIIEVDDLVLEEKKLNKDVKEKNAKLEKKTIEFISNLTDNEIKIVLTIKWVEPICTKIDNLANEVVDEFIKKVDAKVHKYDVTLSSLDEQIDSISKDLAGLLDELVGNEFDLQGLEELKTLLGGGDNE